MGFRTEHKNRQQSAMEVVKMRISSSPDKLIAFPEGTGTTV
jgi:hypothetical protein